MIVFEGVNRSGKSTLAHIVSKKLNLPVIRVCSISQNTGLAPLSESIHKNGAKTNDFYEDMVIMEFITQSKFNKVILDRSLPSADAYRLYKDSLRGGLSKDLISWWITKLKENDGLYVWMNTSWESVQSRGLKKGWLDTWENYINLQKEFFEIYNEACLTGCNAIKIDNNSTDDLNEISDIIVGVYKGIEWRNANV